MVEVTIRLLAGTLASAFLLSLLLTPTTYITAHGVSFIDTELRDTRPEDQLYVQTNFDLGDPDDLLQFPRQFGTWRQTAIHQWDRIASILNADVLISRDYAKPGVYQPLNVVLVKSTETTSFHPAPVCFVMQGWTIVEEARDIRLPVLGTEWARERWIQGMEAGIFDGEIAAKRLVVQRALADGTLQHTMVVYFYVKTEGLWGANGITWVRVDMPIPAADDYEGQQSLAIELLGEIVPNLFTVRPPAESVFDTIRGSGGLPLAGLALVGALLPSLFVTKDHLGLKILGRLRTAGMRLVPPLRPPRRPS